MAEPDKYRQERKRIRQIFHDNKGRYAIPAYRDGDEAARVYDQSQNGAQADEQYWSQVHGTGKKNTIPTRTIAAK